MVNLSTTTTSGSAYFTFSFESEKESESCFTSLLAYTKIASNVFASPFDKLNALMEFQNKIPRTLTISNVPQEATTLIRFFELTRKRLLAHIPCSIEKITEFDSPQMFDKWGEFRARLCQTVGPGFVTYNLPLIREVFDFIQNPSTITSGCIDPDIFDNLKYVLELPERLLLAPGVSQLHHLYEAEEQGELDRVVHRMPLRQIPKAMLLRFLCSLGTKRNKWLDFPLSTEEGVIPRRETLSFEQEYIFHLFTNLDFIQNPDHIFLSTFCRKTIIELKKFIEECAIENAQAKDFFTTCYKNLLDIVAREQKSEIYQNVSKEILEVEMHEAMRAGVAFIKVILEEQKQNMVGKVEEYAHTLDTVTTLVAPLWTPEFMMKRDTEALDWKMVDHLPLSLIKAMSEDSQVRNTISARILTTWLVANNFLQELTNAEKIVAYDDLYNCIRFLQEHEFDEQCIENFVSTVSNTQARCVPIAGDINLYWLVTRLPPENIHKICDITSKFSDISMFNIFRFLAVGGTDFDDFVLLSSHFTHSTIATMCLNKETLPGILHIMKALPESLRISFNTTIKYVDLKLLPEIVLRFLEKASEPHPVPQCLLFEWLTTSARLLETSAARAMSNELQNYLLLYRTLQPKILDENDLIHFFSAFEKKKERDPNLRSPSIPKCVAALREPYLQYFVRFCKDDWSNIPENSIPLSTTVCFQANAKLPPNSPLANILGHLSTLLSPAALFAVCEHPSLLSWMLCYSNTDPSMVRWMDTLFRAKIPIKTISQYFSDCMRHAEVRKLLESKDIGFIRENFRHAVHIAECASKGPCVKPGEVSRIAYELFAQELSVPSRFNLLESFPQQSRPSWSLFYGPWGDLNLSAFSWLPLSSVPIEPLLVYLACLPFSTVSAWLDQIMPTPEGEKRRIDTLSEEQKRAILVRFHQFNSFLPLPHWVEKFSMQDRSAEIAAWCNVTARPMSEKLQRLHLGLQYYVDPMDPISLFIQIHMMEEPWVNVHHQIVVRLLETAEESIICGPRLILTWGHAEANTLCHAVDSIPLQSKTLGSNYSLQNQGVFNDFSTPTSPIELRNRLLSLKENSTQQYTNLIESLKGRAVPSNENMALYLEIERVSVHMRERYPLLSTACETVRKNKVQREVSEHYISSMQCTDPMMIHTPQITAQQIVAMEALIKSFINQFTPTTFLDLVKIVNDFFSHLIDFQKNNEDCEFIRSVALSFLTFLWIGRLASIKTEQEKYIITLSPLISFHVRFLPDTIVSSPSDNLGYDGEIFAQLVTEYQSHTLSAITPNYQCTPKGVVSLFQQLQALSPTDLQSIIQSLLTLISPQTNIDPVGCFATWKKNMPNAEIFSSVAQHWFVSMASNYTSFFSPPMQILKGNTLYLFNPRKTDSFCPRENIPNELLSEGNFASACCARFEAVIPVVENNNCGVNSFLMALHDRTYTQAQARELNREVGLFHAAVVQYATTHRDALIAKYGDRVVDDVISTYGRFQTWASPVVWECAAQLYGRPIHVYSRKQYHNGVFFKTDANGIVESTGGVYEPAERIGPPIHIIHWDGVHYALLKPRI